uniref:Hpt domain-containing protein n=1 Tax=Pontiella sp. TaxID=2837462 RepID=UPI0035673F3F
APEQLRLQIDGLDMEAGLRRMAGRPELYETILKSFADSHADSITKLKTALESGDDRTAKRLAHSLKGAAATIEAAALHQAAVATEKAILDNQHESALAAVQTLEKRLEPLIRQIRQALIAPAANPARPVDADPEPVIARLKTYLEDGNPEALACLGELEAILPAAARLRPLVRKYAFEDALEMLTTIIPKT